MSVEEQDSAGSIARLLRTLTVVVSAFWILALAFSSIANLSYTAEDWRTMWVFSPDEPYEMGKVLRSLEEGRADPHSEFRYGYLYPATGWALGNLYARFGTATDYRRMAITMRAISFFSWIALLLVVLLLLQRLSVPADLATVGTLLVASIASLHARSQMALPDLLQAALIAMALAIAVRWPTVVGLLAAFAAAGLAFGVKYGGAFLIPFLPVPWVAHLWRRRDLRVTRILVVLLCGVGVFLTAYLVTNPYVVYSVPELKHDLKFEKDHVGRGHQMAESPNPLVWFTVLGEVFPGVTGFVVVIGFVALAYAGIRSVSSRKLSGFLGDEQCRASVLEPVRRRRTAHAVCRGSNAPTSLPISRPPSLLCSSHGWPSVSRRHAPGEGARRPACCRSSRCAAVDVRHPPAIRRGLASVRPPALSYR